MVTAAFLAIAATLVVACLSWVLWPLLRGGRLPALGLVFGLGLATFLLYRLVGTPAALDAEATRAAPATLEAAIAQLETELARNPNQPEGWALLGRSYAAQGRGEDARGALARAVALAPDEPDLMVEAAQVRAMADPEKRFDDEAVDLLRRALELQPRHQRARWFLGIWHRQNGRPAEAAREWEALLAEVAPATADTLRPQIDAARAAAGQPPLPQAGAGAVAAEPAAETPPSELTDRALLTVAVEIAPELAARLAPDDTLFVFARQPDGPPMPVAAKKLPARGFPLTVTLGDGDSPMPTLKLSQVERVELVARVSRSGDVAARPGDLESAPRTVTVAPEARPTLVLDRAVE